jgi:O-antigen ligase
VSVSPSPRSLSRLAPGLFAGAAVVALGAADGGYFATSWGAAAIALLAAGAAALALRPRVELARASLLVLTLLGAFVLWALVSLLWTESVPLTALEVQRGVLYVAAFAAAALVASRGSAPAVTGGLLAGIAVLAAWNLVHRALGVERPEEIGALAEPLGYENSLGILVAMGLVLALPLVAERRTRPAGLAAAVLLAIDLAATESRGAVAALAVGVAVALLARRAPTLARAAVVTGVVAVLVAGATTQPRSDYWRVALDQAASAPLTGTGAGTWSRSWLEHRELLQAARDAHSLPLETLAELGAGGLLLVGAALAVPLAGLGRALTRHAAAAAGAYAAFVVHAAVDWDWEVPAVTVAALFCAAALLGDAPARVVTLGSRARTAAFAGAVALACLAAVAHLGNVTTAAARDALAAGSFDQARREARRAERLAPWAAEPWLVRGESELALGDQDAAARSFRRALDRDEGDPEAWLALARAVDGEARAQAVAEAERRNPLGLGG